MKNRRFKRILIVLLFLSARLQGISQISPGDLAEAHAHLEGMSNCTKCHILGSKVSNDKCLDCHSDLKSRITENKGYHASGQVSGKQCTVCHSDHHGRKFEMIRFDAEKFDHNLTGYKLEGSHAIISCNKCHKPEYIRDPKKRSKKSTYLGLATDCLNCHEDSHQKTLSTSCIDCHNYEKFKPAPKFDHSKAKYQLAGKHKEVDCYKCHLEETRNGIPFRKFTGIDFTNCTSCHKDVHENKFGQNCKQCHTEESFHIIRELNKFDHSRTDYPLEGKHRFVDCKACHKTNYTDPLWTNRCTNCHSDYHRKQFAKNGISPDCADCHNVQGFQGSAYTIEKHNVSHFPLKGAHEATPCFTCHKKEKRWEFRNIGLTCMDCHQDIHQPNLDKKFYPENNCLSCHNETRWNNVNFEHTRTRFELAGAHQKVSCRSCHFRVDETGQVHQVFTNLGTGCLNCHKDIHYGQFEKEGQTDCNLCHGFDDWKASRFNHNKTQFKLDGAHVKVACNQCHKPDPTILPVYVIYKIKNYRCEDCHKR